MKFICGLSTKQLWQGGHFVVQNFCPRTSVTLWTAPPPPPLKVSKGHVGKIQKTHMGGGLDVTHLCHTWDPPDHMILFQCGNKRQSPGRVDFARQLPQHCFWFDKASLEGVGCLAIGAPDVIPVAKLLCTFSQQNHK